MTKKLKLFIWPNFVPDYTHGLAFAIAETEEEAKELLAKKTGSADDPNPYSDWGKVEVRSLTRKIARFVDGGS